MKNTYHISRAYSFIFLLYSTVIFAEGEEVGPDLPGDGIDPGTPAAPIDDWIPMIILIALVLAFYLLRRAKAVQQ